MNTGGRPNVIGRSEMQSIPQLAREIEAEASRIESMRQRLISPKGFDSRERVQTSGSQDNALVDVIIDLEQQLEDKRGMFETLRREAKQLITRSALIGEDRAIMMMRYVEAYSWETIEEVMHYSRASVFRRHREILDELFGPEKSKD